MVEYIKWTNDLCAQLRDLRREGRSYQVIGSIMGISPNTISAKCKAMGLGDRLKFKAGKRWSPEEDELLLDLRRESISMSKICRRLNRPDSSVRRRLEVLKRPAMKERKVRECIGPGPHEEGCRRKFKSHGRGNRLCPRCTELIRDVVL